MLAKSIEDIPTGPFSYEPKWDGFRSIVFRDYEEVEIGSRNERPMTRYFPEVVEAIGDDTQALLRVNSKVKFGPDAPEMDARSARLYVLDDDGKIKIEHVIFFLS